MIPGDTELGSGGNPAGPTQPDDLTPDSILIVPDPSVDPPILDDADVQTGTQFYSDYTIDSKTVIDNGLIRLPVAGPPGTPPCIARLHAGFGETTTNWTAERVGEKPSCPHWNSSNPNKVLAGRVIETASPISIPPGVPVHRVSGTYVYYLAATPDDSASYPAGTTPLIQLPPSNTVIFASQFTQGLME